MRHSGAIPPPEERDARQYAEHRAPIDIYKAQPIKFHTGCTRLEENI